MKAYTAVKPFIWVESSAGNTYLCPKDVIADPHNASEEELRRHCIDESQNPHNN